MYALSLWYLPAVQVGERIRAIREAKHLSQGDIQRRTGLFRSYISRVENGFIVPSLETLEKFTRGLQVPLYQLFYEGDTPPAPPPLPRSRAAEKLWGSKGKEARDLMRLRRALASMKDRRRKLLLALAQGMARRHPK